MTTRLALAAVAVFAAACAGGPATGAGGTPGPTAARSAEGLAPDFTVETFDGERFALADQRGRLVVLNFFESW